MADTSAWFALAGALGGVTLAGVLGLVTAGLNHKWGEQTRVKAYREQQLQAITDQRREVCHNYLVATNTYWLTAEQLYFKALRREEFDRIEHMRPAITGLQDTYAYLTISCGTEVRNLAHSYNNALFAAHNAAEEADETKWDELYPKTLDARAILRGAIRTELGVNDLYAAAMTQGYDQASQDRSVTFRFSEGCPGPRESTAGRLSRPDDLLRHLGVRDRLPCVHNKLLARWATEPLYLAI